MNFFAANISDSDEERQEFEIVEDHKGEINSYWCEFTDEDDDEEKTAVISGEEKQMKIIGSACDAFVYHIDTNDWAKAAETFEALHRQVNEYTNRGLFKKRAPMCFLESFVGEDFEASLQGKTRADFSDAKDFRGLKKLVTLVAAVREQYAGDISSMDDVNDEVEVDEDKEEETKVMTADDYTQLLTELASFDGRKSVKLLNIAKHCGRKSFISHQVTALALASVAMLHEDTVSTTIKFATWEGSCKLAQQCLSLLAANRNVHLTEDLSKLSSKSAVVPEGLSSIADLLHAKLLQISQFLGGSKEEYTKVPLLENSLVILADTILRYYNQTGSNRKATVNCSRILMETLGPRRQEAHDLLYRMQPEESYFSVTGSVLETVKLLYKRLAISSDTDIKMSSACYIAYQYGLMAKHSEGREILLRMGVQDYVMSQKSVSAPSAFGMKTPLQILFNRAIAQLGLAAFISGDLQEAYQLSGAIYSLPQMRTQIGQGVPPTAYRDKVENELQFRDLCVAPHHYIPQDHLQLSAMLTALVIDTTLQAKNSHESSRLQKFFYRAISERSQYTGKLLPIDSLVSEAYNALTSGNYNDAKDAIMRIPAWETLPNGKAVLARYLEELRDAAVRVFCLTNGSNFTTFSVPLLAIKYETEEARVRGILNEIISENNALTAYWDRDDTYLYVDRSNPTQLQHRVLNAAENVSSLAPYTERRMRGNEGRGRGFGRGRGGARGGN